MKNLTCQFALVAILLSACIRPHGLDGMGGFVASSEACVAGEIAFAETLENFRDELSSLNTDAARQFYATKIAKRDGLAPVFGTVWAMSYEEALRKGTSVVAAFEDLPDREGLGAPASTLRAARNVARDQYGEFCFFLAGKLIASGKARRDLERLSRGVE